jgi:glutaconate CoA-transferase subunit B
VHGGESAASVAAATGFSFDRPDVVPATPMLSAADRELLKGRIAPELAETYPRFAAALAAAA